MGNQLGLHDIRVSLLVLENGEIINLDSPGDFVIGRLSQNPVTNGGDGDATEYTEIDLSSFQAYETGVSRRHASLTIRSEGISLTDLGSTNGTRLNGNIIPALTPQEVHNEDIITLGKLKVQILLLPT
jgi:pSer/pThr/pTyr-binding forkhead associated (FHA) protein